MDIKLKLATQRRDRRARHKLLLMAMNGSLKNKVIGHADTVVLRDVFFVVGLAGRKRAVL